MVAFLVYWKNAAKPASSRLVARTVRLLQSSNCRRVVGKDNGKNLGRNVMDCSLQNRGLLGSPMELKHGRFLVSSSSSSLSGEKPEEKLVIDRKDLRHAINCVNKYDASGYWPGRFLPSRSVLGDELQQEAYYVVRSFWVETGLRRKGLEPDLQHAQLDWWQHGIDLVYDEDDDKVNDKLNQEWATHPTLRLLRTLRIYIQKSSPSLWNQQLFDRLIQGRRQELETRQYETLDDLVQYAQISCGSLFKLVLESSRDPILQFAPQDESSTTQAQGSEGMITSTTSKLNSVIGQIVNDVAVCHGITHALRRSIPVLSTTGQLLVPLELTVRHGVRSPRYLLSALGQGDEACLAAFQHVVRDIAECATSHLSHARQERATLLQLASEAKQQQQKQQQGDSSRTDASKSGSALGTVHSNRSALGTVRSNMLPVLLPSIASEIFLERLAAADYQLTNRNLRQTGPWEHLQCLYRMSAAYFRSRY